MILVIVLVGDAADATMILFFIFLMVMIIISAIIVKGCYDDTYHRHRWRCSRCYNDTSSPLSSSSSFLYFLYRNQKGC